MKKEEMLILKGISLCYKPYLKIQEAMIYTGLGRTQLMKRTEEFGIRKTENGYFRKVDLDRMLSGEQPTIQEIAAKLRVRKK